ncbi:MAG: DUF2500 domain-containing protein [Clostridia bacterium]|nr:DUF2500 domain-containing protein [Clostridia bacterium]
MGFLFIIPFILVPLVFLLVGGIFAFVFVRMIKEKKQNDRSPRLTVEAKIVDKRTASHGRGNHYSDIYSCYVTFEFESGDRAELYVPSNEYGLLVVGDVGLLTLQGTRYIRFERNREAGR